MSEKWLKGELPVFNQSKGLAEMSKAELIAAINSDRAAEELAKRRVSELEPVVEEYNGLKTRLESWNVGRKSRITAMYALADLVLKENL